VFFLDLLLLFAEKIDKGTIEVVVFGVFVLEEGFVV
jgi:hypothetical protein